MQPPNPQDINSKKQGQSKLKFNHKLYFFQSSEYSLFLYYNYSHPVMEKKNFIYGNIKIFSNTNLYENTINSLHNLNSGFDWDQNFFKKILENFEYFKIQKKSAEDENDQSLEMLVENEIQEIYEILIKVPLTETFGKDIQRQFWNQFANFNDYKNLQIKSKVQSNEQLMIKKVQKLQKLKEYQIQCEQNKKILLGRLTAVMRQKVNKLKEFGEDYDIVQDQDRYIEDDGEPRIMNTYQQQKAFLGSLFEPSQNFYH